MKNVNITYDFAVIFLCLEPMSKSVSVITVFEAKWTKHENWSNLCLIGIHFYPTNKFVSTFK